MLLAGLYHKFHHDQRSDGDHFIVLVADGHQILQGGGHNTLGAVAAVVGHHPQFLAAGTELVLQNQKILVAEADHAVDYTALFMQSTGHRQRNGAAYAAAYYADLFQALGLGGAAQGANKVMDAVADIQPVQLHGGAAHDLENDIYSALFPVVTGHSQGDALAVFKRAHDDELARQCLFGNQRRLDRHLDHGGVQRDLFDDLIHCGCSFYLCIPKLSLHKTQCADTRRLRVRDSLSLIIISAFQLDCNIFKPVVWKKTDIADNPTKILNL